MPLSCGARAQGRRLCPVGRGLRAGASVLRGESFSFLTETL